MPFFSRLPYTTQLATHGVVDLRRLVQYFPTWPCVLICTQVFAKHVYHLTNVCCQAENRIRDFAKRKVDIGIYSIVIIQPILLNSHCAFVFSLPLQSESMYIGGNFSDYSRNYFTNATFNFPLTFRPLDMMTTLC